MSSRFFSYIYNLYYKKACCFVKYYVRDEGVSEDIATEALLKVWREIKVEDVESTRRLLITILRNKSYDYLRHEQVKQAVFNDICNSQRQELRISICSWKEASHCELFSEEVCHILTQTLAMLPERTQKVFQMIRIHEMKYHEAACRIGISAKGIDYHVSKAQRALRIALKDYL